jgi:hypothetical protein
LIPIAAPLAVATNLALPRLAQQINGSWLARAAPAVGWILAMFLLLSGRPEGDVVLPAVPTDVKWNTWALLLAGMVSAIVSLTLPITRPRAGRGGRGRGDGEVDRHTRPR